MDRHNSEVTVGRWRLLRPLGAGGFAEVFAAVDGDGNVASVKCLRPPGSPNRGVTGRMRAEVRALELVSGRTPHLPLIVEADLDADPPFIAMELLNGPTAAAHIAQHGPVTDPATLMSVAAALALALRELHDLELVHRDVKPSNVIFVPGRGAVLIDLGIALGPDWTRNTGGGVVGTDGYVAKEIYNGAPATTASDVFAWSATLVELASGTKVFGTNLEVMVQRVFDDRPEIGAALDGLPPSFADLLRRGLSPDAAVRPSVAEALRVLTELHEPARHVGPRGRWVDAWGRTVEDAVKRAAAHIGVDRNALEVQVVKDPRFGGLLPNSAQVRARIRPPAIDLPVQPVAVDLNDDGGVVTGHHRAPRAVRRRHRELAGVMRGLLDLRCQAAAAELAAALDSFGAAPVSERQALAGRVAQLSHDLGVATELLYGRDEWVEVEASSLKRAKTDICQILDATEEEVEFDRVSWPAPAPPWAPPGVWRVRGRLRHS